MIALVFLVLVGAVTISGLAVAEHLHRVGGVEPPAFSTMSFIDRIESEPFWAHGWLWAILLTTLLPTLLHFVLALRAALVSAVPKEMEDWLVEQIRRAPGNSGARGQAQLVLTAFPTLATVLALSIAISGAWLFTVAYTDWRDDMIAGARDIVTFIHTNWSGWPFIG